MVEPSLYVVQLSHKLSLVEVTLILRSNEVSYEKFFVLAAAFDSFLLALDFKLTFFNDINVVSRFILSIDCLVPFEVFVGKRQRYLGKLVHGPVVQEGQRMQEVQQLLFLPLFLFKQELLIELPVDNSKLTISQCMNGGIPSVLTILVLHKS